jgi:DNA-binding transcriptional MerR regulator
VITIGQLAAYAGVTIKAVRHYHQRGVLEEPPRDASGYRRYSAEHDIQLLKIKTLADAGVPLADIKELLTADPDRFAAAIAEIDQNLQERAEELRRTRERLAQLRAGDRLFISAEVADYLDRLHELGVSRRTVQMEREGWILMQSVSPNEAASWLADKRAAIGDPEFCAVYLAYDAAFDWSPDDQRRSPHTTHRARTPGGLRADSPPSATSPGDRRGRDVRCVPTRVRHRYRPNWLAVCGHCSASAKTSRSAISSSQNLAPEPRAPPPYWLSLQDGDPPCGAPSRWSGAPQQAQLTCSTRT